MDHVCHVSLVAGQYAVELLDHGHVTPDLLEHRRQFHPDVARTDDEESVRNRLERQGVLRREHVLAVEPEAGNLDRTTPRRDDSVLERHCLGALTVSGFHHPHLAVAGELGPAGHQCRPGPLTQRLDTLCEPVDDLVLPADHRRHVHGRLSVHTHPLGLAGTVCQPRGRDECLRGDTAVVETAAAVVVHLDDGHVAAELCGAYRRHVAARTAADNQYVRASRDIANYHL